MKRALWLLLLAACEPRATASEPPGAPPPPELASKEYESCAASADCATGLACIDAACKRTARSRIGDYQAAAGAVAARKGDARGAVASYAAALAQYSTDKLATPPDLDCSYGASLVAMAQVAAPAAAAKFDELAATVLHRCILATPPGSALAGGAYEQLAALEPLGLDPALLGASTVADLYLTKPARRAGTDKLAVTVVASPVPTAKSFAQLPEALQAPALRSALVGCWSGLNAATGASTLTVSVAVKASFVESDYEGEGRFFITLDRPAGLSGPEAAADLCVRSVVEAATKSMKLSDGFATNLAITIQ